MIDFSGNKACVKHISIHLNRVDHLFVPALSSYIDIDSYSKKLFEKAERIELWKNEELIGLLAFYIDGNNAFITNVSLDSSVQKLGYGKKLFIRFFELIETKNIKNVDLDVKSINIKAINFYKSLGFHVKTNSLNTVSLSYNLKR